MFTKGGMAVKFCHGQSQVGKSTSSSMSLLTLGLWFCPRVNCLRKRRCEGYALKQGKQIVQKQFDNKAEGEDCLGNAVGGMISFRIKGKPQDAWVAQSVKCLPSAQVMILGSLD